MKHWKCLFNYHRMDELTDYQGLIGYWCRRCGYKLVPDRHWKRWHDKLMLPFYSWSTRFSPAYHSRNVVGSYEWRHAQADAEEAAKRGE